jgi:hypothetical protein
MIRLLANWAARKYYVFSQEFQATTADLHAGLSLRLAGEKRALVEKLNKEADDIEANIKKVDEQLAKGYFECESGHEKADAFIPEVTTPGAPRLCLDCKAPTKFVSLTTMTGQEKYESDKERKEAETIMKNKRATAKAEEENAAGSEKAAKYFQDQAKNNRTIADKVRSL